MSYLSMLWCMLIVLTARNQLNNLDFADDLAIPSHTHEQMRMKTTTVAAVSTEISLNIHKGKRKTLKYNTKNTKYNHT